MKHLLPFLLLLLSVPGFAQSGLSFQDDSLPEIDLTVTVYKTYESFLNGSGREAGTLSNYKWSNLPKSLKLICQENENSTFATVEVGDCWGFTVGTQLFRIGEEYCIPFFLYESAELAYYESGRAQLEYLLFGSATIFYASDLANYSLSLNDPIIPVQKAKKIYKKDHPELTEICSCIEASFNQFAHETNSRDQNGRAQRYVLRNRACIRESKMRLEKSDD
jgi:hypothetical protein